MITCWNIFPTLTPKEHCLCTAGGVFPVFPLERASQADPHVSEGHVLTLSASLCTSARLEQPVYGLLTSNVRQMPWFSWETPSIPRRWATWEINRQINLWNIGRWFALSHFEFHVFPQRLSWVSGPSALCFSRYLSTFSFFFWCGRRANIQHQLFHFRQNPKVP